MYIQRRIVSTMNWLSFSILIILGANAALSFKAPETQTVRVMIRKEFMLQPDGSYKEVSAVQNQVTTPNPASGVNNDHFIVDPYIPSGSAPRSTVVHSSYALPSYTYTNPRPSPKFYTYSPDIGSYFSASDVQDVMRQLESQHQRSEMTASGSRFRPEYVPYYRPQKSSRNAAAFAAASSAQPVQVQYHRYEPSYEVKKAISSHSFMINEDPRKPNKKKVQTAVFGAKTAAAKKTPKNIHDIITKTMGQNETLRSPSASAAAAADNSQYYSPRDANPAHFSYSHFEEGNSQGLGGYDNTFYGLPSGPSGGGFGGGGAGYNGPPATPSPVVPHYGPPPPSPVVEAVTPVVTSAGGGWGHHQGNGGFGGVVNSLFHTVKDVSHSKGELGSTILHQGGHFVSEAVHQKAEKAKIIGHTLSQVPQRFSQVLRSKAHFASGALESGSKALSSVLGVKAATLNQASHLIAAKGKAATAVIKAGGGTTADLILAKGKGLASLITTGGKATTALLNFKGKNLESLGEVLAGVAKAKGGGHHENHHHHGWGSHHQGDIIGGYSHQVDQYQASPSSSVYDELGDALKSVIQSPSSSYGSNPYATSSSDPKLSSAFKSLYDNFKATAARFTGTGDSQGSPSSSVESWKKAPEDSGAVKSKSFSQNANAIGDSLTKMSSVFNSVANAIDWLSPNSNTKS